ncbi:MAG: Kynurenine formamidase [Parcubacteria group bacterium GW2011_GWA1_47_8]|nr:MAG: Kynurenine formamidase [Parcubacteria group bacterium GW2011_GWA1_47_8]KKW07830.1 MAG: Kynurenine formamidase [Parcubacteria group bacterium GW2011_GWA2_49_16]
MRGKKIFDISLLLENGMIVYPNNPEVRIERVEGETSVRSDISMGTHTGTHIDAPRHVFKDGKGVSDIPLSTYIGKCRVLDFSKVKESITIDDLKKYKIKKGERILVKTSNSKRGFAAFYDDYVYLDGDAADYLAQKRILVFGIDSLSVKKRGGSDQRPHTSLLKKGVTIFEGINLAGVKEGGYTFIGFPLKMGSIDGAPARAILIQN